MRAQAHHRQKDRTTDSFAHSTAARPARTKSDRGEESDHSHKATNQVLHRTRSQDLDAGKRHSKHNPHCAYMHRIAQHHLVRLRSAKVCWELLDAGGVR